MDESSTNADCELEFIGKGYTPWRPLKFAPVRKGAAPKEIRRSLARVKVGNIDWDEHSGR